MASSGSKKFRDFAAAEASAAINKALSTRLTKSIGDLQTFRKSLDEAAKAFEKALGAAADSDAAIAELVEKMATAAAADAQEQVQRVKTEADSIIAAAKSELGKAVEAANEARGQAARARDSHAKAEVARREVDAALQRESKEKDAAVNEAKDIKTLLDGMLAKQKAVEEQRVQLANQLKTSVAKIEALERGASEAERKHAELVAKAKADAEVAAKSGSALDLVLHTVQTIGGGSTTEDILASLANGLTHDFSRVAVFRFRASRFNCEYEVGFGPKIDMSKATIPVTTDSPLTRALSSNKAESFAARALAESGCTMLAGTPQAVLTIPVTVFDETLAVIYADDSDRAQKQTNGEQAASFAEVLRRFAIPLLEKRSIAPKLREELREYAALLLEELEYVHTSDVNAGKKEAEIRAHLKENLNGARDMYQQRVASEPPAAGALFDEKLRSIVDGKANTPFGKDLAATAGVPASQPAKARAR